MALPCLAQLADLATFALAVAALGIEHELTPTVRAAYGMAGLAGVALLNAAYMGIVWLVARAYLWHGSTVWLLRIVTAGCSLGAAANVAALAGLAL
jgi:hypothetical protein